MKTTHLLLAAMLASAFAPAHARSGADAGDAPFTLEFDSGDSASDQASPAHPAVRVRERVVVDTGELGRMVHVDQADFTAPLMLGRARNVKNAPYSAEVVSERIQNLPDGNQIVNKTSSLTYRDSAGRTRQETRDAKGTVRAVTIHDSVANATWVLRPQEKTAVRIDLGPELAHAQARVAGEQARIAGEKARLAGERARIAAEKARSHADALRRHEGDQVIVKRIERVDGEAGERIREDVRIRVASDLARGGHPMPDMDRFAPMIAGAFGDMRWAAKAATKDLGTKEIEGVKAQGKLRSYEIPAGEVGNRNPIVVSTESWYAPDLQVTVLTRRSDPRTGERIYRLDGLKREEPAAALFAVPSDYTIRESGAGARKQIEIRQP